MRWLAVGLVPLMLPGCGAKYKPAGPVMSGYERAIRFPVHRPHGDLVYSGRDPATTAPVIPLMAFGAAFDMDVTLMPRDGQFELIEFARLNVPDGHLWLAVETAAESGDQTLVTNIDDFDAMMPELPLSRRSVDTFSVTDNSTEATVDVTLSYDNSVGDRVEAVIVGDAPTKQNNKRNGKTFNHSQNQLLSVLDVPASESLFKADVQVGGKGLKLKKVGGIVPGRYVIEQAQGGLAVATYQVLPNGPAAGGSGYGDIMVRGGSSMAPEPAPEPSKPSLAPDILVRMSVANNFESIQTCYGTALEAVEEGAEAPAGQMQFAWSVTEGVVSDVAVSELEGDDILVDEALGACIVEAIGGWKLDEAVTGAVSWPFTFTPEDENGEMKVAIGEGSSELEGMDEEAPEEEEEGTDGATRPEENPESLGDEDLLEGVDMAAEGEDGEDLGDEDPDAIDGATPPEMAPAALSNFSTVHKVPSGAEVEMKWLVTQKGNRVSAVQTTPLRTLTYNYRYVAENYLELVSITVEQYGRATPVTAITFNPPIPDLRWPFNGRRTSDMVVDVNGQQSHAYAQVDAYWSESGPKLKVTPLEPAWARDRVMQTSIIFQQGAANVAIERIGD